MANVVLTSNVEVVSGVHLACAEQLVVMTCTGSSTNYLNWDGSIFQNPVQYSIFTDSVGDTFDRAMNTFTANLTQVNITQVTPKLATLTSTLTVTATASLDGTTVECDTGGESKSLILNVTSGNQFRSALLVLWCLPVSIHSYTISPPVPTAQCVRVWGGWSHCYCRVDVP